MNFCSRPQRSTRLTLALGVACALMGCTQDPPQERGEVEIAKPEGTILGGDISDDMVPLERLRSQSPPLETSAQGALEAPRNPDGEDSLNVEAEVSPPPEVDPDSPED